MNKKKSYYETMLKILSSPPSPKKPDERNFLSPIAFPDSDATSEEIEEYLNKKQDKH